MEETNSKTTANLPLRSIYLDYTSSTPIAGSVREAMLPFLSEHFGDPSSDHWMGRVAAEAIEDARNAIATLLGCHPSEIYFTSGGTESINLGLVGFATELSNTEPELTEPHLIISAIEHLAVSRCAEELQRRDGESPELAAIITEPSRLVTSSLPFATRTRLISVMHVNHEIGAIQPIHEIADLCAGKNITLHTDACRASASSSVMLANSRSICSR